MEDVIPPSHSASRDAVTPPKSLAGDVEKAKRDAAGYVAWRHSRIENIEILTDLTKNLNDSVAVMEEHQVRGRYRPADVAATQRALQKLRTFLANKGD